MRVFAYITVPKVGLTTVLYVPITEEVVPDIVILKRQTTSGVYDPKKSIYDNARISSHVIQIGSNNCNVSRNAMQIINSWNNRIDELFFINAIEYKPVGSEVEWSPVALVTSYVYRSGVRTSPSAKTINIEIIDFVVVQYM